jgi:hypothetical protein
MQLTIQIPDDIAHRLIEAGGGICRVARWKVWRWNVWRWKISRRAI